MASSWKVGKMVTVMGLVFVCALQLEAVETSCKFRCGD
jgi:hypothetical protein